MLLFCPICESTVSLIGEEFKHPLDGAYYFYCKNVAINF